MTTNASKMFADMSAAEQQKAIDRYRSDMEFDSEFRTDDILNTASIIFNDLIKIQWSGFYSQGDGLAISGDLDYVAGSYHTIVSMFPNDTVIQQIAKDWQQVQKRYFYQLRAECRATRNNNTISNVIDRRDYRIQVTREVEKEIDRVIGEFCHWGYNLLQKEWEYQSSDHQIQELLMAE